MIHFLLLFIVVLFHVQGEVQIQSSTSSLLSFLKCNLSSLSLITSTVYYKKVSKLKIHTSSNAIYSFIELEPYLTYEQVKERLILSFPENYQNISTLLGKGHPITNWNSTLKVVFREYSDYYQPLLDEQSSSNDLIKKKEFPLIDCSYGENKNRPSLSVVTEGKPVAKKNNKRKAIKSADNADAAKKSASQLITIVSGYWKISNHKYSKIKQRGNAAYEEWMASTLKVNMPYIIFTDEKTLPVISPYRDEFSFPTIYLLNNISNFRVFSSYNPEWTHSLHVPSSELGMIWQEKLNLLTLASQFVNKPFLAWIDAGNAFYRNRFPPSSKEWSSKVISTLPLDKISYCYVKEDYHSFAATAFIIPKKMLPLLDELFYNEYEIAKKEINDWRCGSEQFLWTRLREKYPSLFHIMSYGYGDLDFLWGKKKNKANTDSL
jgi:hypothetical protein